LAQQRNKNDKERSLTSKSQIKEKVTKENMGYLPRVLFFNAFQLGIK
jgi:hypothetical protein